MVDEEEDGIDWEDLGLKVGLEIHQQLDTGKLFCQCPTELTDEDATEVVRWLRPTQSEMGEVDRASLLEARRDLQFIYQSPPSSSCLVELDEEPPHDMNPEAVEVALIVSRLLRASIADEIHVMRKIVIDGSNTTGFQRTAQVAMDGMVTTEMGEVPVSLICLEEDAARRVETRPGQVVYRLDRLGIPLIEIATGPVMGRPDQVRSVARTIGMALRATRMVKRGLGTIRQDLNVSIEGGSRIEIKGVQDLRAIPSIVMEEARRQLALLSMTSILEKRGYGPGNWPDPDIVDVTEVFPETSSRVIGRSLEKGGRVMGVRLRGFAGLLGARPDNEVSRGGLRVEEFELGAELATYARTAGVRGIFHSDELPGMGITGEETDGVASMLGLEDDDAFAIVAEDETTARGALEQVIERCRMALEGVPSEVRGVRDGDEIMFSDYQRPMPGAARMYPETDIPPFRVSQEVLEGLELPELPADRVRRFERELGLNRQQAEQVVRSDLDDLCEELCGRFPDQSSLVARTLLNTLSELESDGVRIEEGDMIAAVLGAVDEGVLAKEGVPDVLGMMASGDFDLEGAMEELGLSGGPDLDDIRDRVRELIEERASLIREKGQGAFGPLMGEVMKEFRGKADGKVISDILKEELGAVLDR